MNGELKRGRECAIGIVIKSKDVPCERMFEIYECAYLHCF